VRVIKRKTVVLCFLKIEPRIDPKNNLGPQSYSVADPPIEVRSEPILESSDTQLLPILSP
jgi:hypothetical protein